MKTPARPEFILPEWSTPSGVRAAVTTRLGGVSAAPWDSFNLAGHVGDAEAAVAENRRRLVEALALPGEPLWLNQVHGVAVADAATAGQGAEADASYSRQAGVVCAVMTADCLPLLFCHEKGQVVGAAHAGWRGLAGGVIEATVAAMAVPAQDLLVWLGPAIGPAAFEVGDEVRAEFVTQDAGAASAFQAHGPGKWLADLYSLARLRLQRLGVTRVYGGGLCTFGDARRFYSYRRDGVCGRMASLIWLDSAE